MGLAVGMLLIIAVMAWYAIMLMCLFNAGLCAGAVILGAHLIKSLRREQSALSKGKKAGNIVLISLLGLFVIIVPAFTIWVVVSAAGITLGLFGGIAEYIGIF